MLLWVKEEIWPIRISLHISELKELSQAKNQNLFTDLVQNIEEESSIEIEPLNKGIISVYLLGILGTEYMFCGTVQVSVWTQFPHIQMSIRLS